MNKAYHSFGRLFLWLSLTKWLGERIVTVIRLFGGKACDYTGVIESGDDTSGYRARLSLAGQGMVSERIQ